jgi:hypothetical protein
MNYIKAKRQKVQIGLQPGDILTDSNTTFFILMKYETDYIAVNLENGEPWHDASTSPEVATDGLSFYGRDIEIELKQ